MKERIDQLRLQVGISRLEDDPRLIAVNKDGSVGDPYRALEQFAELIVQECCNVFVELRTRPADLAAKDVKRHFGVEE